MEAERDTPCRMSRFPRLLFFAGGAAICAASFLLDASVIAWVARHPSRSVKHAAQFFTRWGDFPPIIGLLLVLLIAAWALKRTPAIRLLLLMMGSACAGGLAANVLRILTGRTRPDSAAIPGWYGMWNHGRWIAGAYQYSSFPSAHTAVAIACVAPLWILPGVRRRIAVALPATGIALCIAASRILLAAHHLSDVVTSIWLGTWMAMAVCSRFRVGAK